MQFTKADLKLNPINCLACCIYFEARGEPDESKHWVGHVVMNRVETVLFPNTVYDVIFQTHQFSWTIGKSTFFIKEPNAWSECLQIAQQVYEREKDITNRALYFLTTNLNPSWTKKLKVRKVIGHMKFLGK